MSNDPKLSEAAMKPAGGKPRRAWLGWFLWLTTVAGLCFVRHEGIQRDAEIQRNQEVLLKVMTKADQAMAAIDSNKVVAAIAKQEENMRALQVRTETSATSLTEALKQQKDVNGRMLAVLGPDGGDIEDALKLAEDAKSAGNLDLALVYLANAIRNQPRDMRLLEKYTAWVVGAKNPTVMQGAENLLQGALYGVAAKDVLEVAKRLEDVTNARTAQEKNVEVPNGSDLSPADAFAELGKVTLESFSGDRKKVEARIEALSAVLEQIDEADQPDAKLRDQVSQRMEEAQACALALQVLDLADLRFSNLAVTEKLVATEPSGNHHTAALSALQATEAAVNQVWSVPVALVTSELKGKLIVLPEKLRTLAEKIQDSVGKEDIKIARAVWAKRPNLTSNLIQERVIGCQAAIKVCSESLGKVQGPDSRKEAAKLYEEMSGEMKKLKEQQLAAYQKWATTVIEATRKRYDDNKISDDNDAEQAFYTKDIQKVDQTLLTPEVAQFLQAVFQKLLGELEGDKKARLLNAMSFSTVPKMKLENF